MANDQAATSPAKIATEQINELLSKQTQQGLTQSEIAARAGIPAQYLSDIKRGERPVTELLARRLGEELQFSYRWLLGISDEMELSAPPSRSSAAGHLAGLPLLGHPIEGEPRQSPHWQGYIAEIAGLAAGRIGLANPLYILEFGRDDTEGRLHNGDWILISQTVNSGAEIRVIRYRRQCYLARANRDSDWRRVANGEDFNGACTEVGHAVAVIWSPLS